MALLTVNLKWVYIGQRCHSPWLNEGLAEGLENRMLSERAKENDLQPELNK
jgi:hypothetical protein